MLLLICLRLLHKVLPPPPQERGGEVGLCIGSNHFPRERDDRLIFISPNSKMLLVILFKTTAQSSTPASPGKERWGRV